MQSVVCAILQKTGKSFETIAKKLTISYYRIKQ